MKTEKQRNTLSFLVACLKFNRQRAITKRRILKLWRNKLGHQSRRNTIPLISRKIKGEKKREEK